MLGFPHEESICEFVQWGGASQLYKLHDDTGNTPASIEFHSERPGNAARVDEL